MPCPRLTTCQRTLVLIAAVAALGGCGMEAVGSAATGAAVKKQELDQAQAQRDAVQRQLEQGQQQGQQRQRALEEAVSR